LVSSRVKGALTLVLSHIGLSCCYLTSFLYRNRCGASAAMPRRSLRWDS
jgi:hypothetical protein